MNHSGWDRTVEAPLSGRVPGKHVRHWEPAVGANNMIKYLRINRSPGEAITAPVHALPTATCKRELAERTPSLCVRIFRCSTFESQPKAQPVSDAARTRWSVRRSASPSRGSLAISSTRIGNRAAKKKDQQLQLAVVKKQAKITNLQ